MDDRNFETIQTPDFDRRRRRLFGETVYGEGKGAGALKTCIETMLEREGEVLVTRLDEEKFNDLGKLRERLDYDATSRTAVVKKKAPSLGTVAVVTAGTSDIPVAEECARTLEYFHVNFKRIYDIGVAGIHRLFSKLDDLREADVIVVCAGMDGALASVVAGLVENPVIGVPTSIGYGAAFQGVAPLLGMLNSCAEGVTVVNIDNGYGAAYAAAQIVATLYGKSK
ncbi:MAG: nickel pincer cofactor biosynthesis protein LarB [Peptoniphilus sp.]|nr:nickel pincer cofactor biosynthesis protein LarB [Peptoniphilus sp.]MDD7362555.1 nickel pincer cofactor biosynthesis protein LarB [Bacillota bacterium]MDY6045046.1 nickel pincer cofactor biosynthesis protein LarB [Peptoniphilus sp.]